MTEQTLFVPGQVYRRRDLHDRYGGQQQGGISTPSRHNLIFLFTGDAGQQHGYHDQWSADEIFLYTGEGQKGDMQYVSGNRAIRDHARDGKDLHLFKQDRKAYVRYIGQMVCTGAHYENAPDTDDVLRKAIVFELTPIEEFNQLQEAKDPELLSLAQESLATLRQKALDQSVDAVTPQERKSVWRRRSTAIRIYVLKRASGNCEGCHATAPFKRPDGEPYLEPHHIRRLSDGGPDHPRWVIALCPNCHRRVHHAHDASDYNEQLSDVMLRIEGKE
jgi:5-methylcytosine-specific restriction protein A